MLIDPLLASSALPAGPPAEPVVLSTRVRLARNLAGHHFPGWAKKAHRQSVMRTCLEKLAALPELKSGLALEMDALEPLEKQILVERHLISRELSESDNSSAALIAADQTVSVMINEEDHLRIQVLRPGFDLKAAWAAIDALDTGIETRLDYAFSADLGYLTACPTNLGTGMRASAMLHLPGLVIEEHMEKVVRSVNQLGMAVRGLYGEGSEATGSIFQISNQQTLGESEAQILKRLQSVLKAIIEQERNARLKILEENPAKMLDRIGRAFGILQNGHVLSSDEAMNLLSLIRLGVDLGMLPGLTRERVDALFIECQPGHIQVRATEAADPAQRDRLRAESIRLAFRAIALPGTPSLSS